MCSRITGEPTEPKLWVPSSILADSCAPVDISPAARRRRATERTKRTLAKLTRSQDQPHTRRPLTLSLPSLRSTRAFGLHRTHRCNFLTRSPSSGASAARERVGPGNPGRVNPPRTWSASSTLAPYSFASAASPPRSPQAVSCDVPARFRNAVWSTPGEPLRPSALQASTPTPTARRC